MDRTTPPTLHEPDGQIFPLCEEHLTREENLLANLLDSLRQVRDAFFQRNLGILPTLQSHQEQLLSSAWEISVAHDHLRDALADLLGVPAREATLRAAAGTMAEPERGRLLEKRARLACLVREVEQLSEQNAALLGYCRGFLASLFAGLTGTSLSECYGPQGERRGMMYGPFLQARG